MAIYIYLPVPGDVFSATQGNNLGRYLTHRGERTYLVRNPHARGPKKGLYRITKGGCLRHCGKSDTLYLILHGRHEGSRFVGGERMPRDPLEAKKELKKYSPKQLAATISAEGLPLIFKDLRLLVCGSAVRPASEQPYAQRLAKAVGNLGYSSIRVTGYTGSVTVRVPADSAWTDEHGIALVTGGALKRTPAQASTKTYGPSGKQVTVTWTDPYG